MVAAALVALALAGGGYSGVALGAATVLVWLLVLVAMLRGHTGSAAPGPLVASCLCLIALAGLTAYSLAWASDDGAGFVVAVRAAGYGGAFALAALTLRAERAGNVLTGLGAGILVVALVALGGRLVGLGNGDAGLVDVLASAGGRLSYPIGYWNGLGALVAMAVPLLLRLATGAAAERPRRWPLAALPLLLLVIYMTSSRGALLGAALGTAVLAGFAPSGRRVAAAAVVGIAAALPAVVLAGLLDGILDGPGTGAPGASEAALAAALAAGAAGAAWLGPRIVVGLGELNLPRIGLRLLLPGLAAMAIVVVAAVGPSQFIDDFRTPSKQAAATAQDQPEILTFSGSGRAQFWGTALDAFADEPVRGGGAGSYPAYWNAHGSLDTPTKNAHSEPLELMAELGLPGVALFLAFFALVVAAGVRRARGADGGAALGVVAAASVGFLIDWTWQIPAVVVPALIAAAILAGSPGVAEAGSDGERGRGRPGRGPVAALRVGLVLLALPALWAGGVLALATGRLDASADAFERGDYGEAAQAARAAAAIEPWAGEPWVRLATIEQAAGNVDAARIDVRAAIDRAPEDFRPWVLAAGIAYRGGRFESGTGYAVRALELAPRVLRRIAFTPQGRSDNGL